MFVVEAVLAPQKQDDDVLPKFSFGPVLVKYAK